MDASAIRKSWVLGLVLLSVTAAVGDTVYKWVDERGVTHYSQTPPPKQKPQTRELESSPPSQTTKGDRTVSDEWRENNAEFDRKWKERKKAEEAEAESAAKASSDRLAQCERARAELARLIATKPAIRGRPTISLRDPKTGQEVELMNNAERTMRIHQAEDDIRKWCD